jgi:hypothetical protein
VKLRKKSLNLTWMKRSLYRAADGVEPVPEVGEDELVSKVDEEKSVPKVREPLWEDVG